MAASAANNGRSAISNTRPEGAVPEIPIAAAVSGTAPTIAVTRDELNSAKVRDRSHSNHREITVNQPGDYLR